MAKILVLIHIQPGIIECAPLAMIDFVAELAADYIRVGAPIFIIELDGYTATATWLQATLAGYEKAFYLRSELTDGSVAISQAIAQGALADCKTSNGKPPTLKTELLEFEVGGLYSYACVFDTVAGLSRRFSTAQIVVNKSACDSYLEGDWSAFQSLSAVSVK